MSRVDELPADQRAALSLLLRRRRSYADVAAALKIPERAVRDRAHAALAVLAPGKARALDADRRAEIGDYLLGQQADAGERLRTRTLLSSSEPANAWAAALAEKLSELAEGALPEVPPLVPAAEQAGTEAGTAEPVPLAQVASESAAAPLPAGERAQPSFGRAPASPPSSRRGGAILLALILVAAVVVVILVVSGGGSSHNKTASTSGTTGTSTSASSGSPKVEATIQMHAASGSAAKGAVEILSEGGKRAFYILAEHLPESKGFFYAVWLYNSPSNAEALSKAKPVTSNGRLAGAAALPSNASSYREILLTRETSARPSKPGPVELRGTLALQG